MSDLDWVKSGEEAITDCTKGDVIKIKILDIDVDKERISLGVKQLTKDPVATGVLKIKKGDIVTCKITTILENGIEVIVNNDIPGFIRRGDLSRDRSEQRPDRFAAGEVVDAIITTVDKTQRKVNLSIKAREVQEEKIAMAEFGSSDSGASLGDILGAAIKERSETENEKTKKIRKEDPNTDDVEEISDGGEKGQIDAKKKVMAVTTDKEEKTSKKKTVTATKSAPKKKSVAKDADEEETPPKKKATATKKKKGAKTSDD
jgi:predicted RNA-binding protein with RPS1 domain